MSQVATKLDIGRQRGDTWAFTITFDNSTKTLDITGGTFLLTVDPSPDPETSADNLFQLTGTIIQTGPNTGVGGTGFSPQVQFEPSDVQADQPPREYYFDFQWTDAAAKDRTVAKGIWDVAQDITK